MKWYYTILTRLALFASCAVQIVEANHPYRHSQPTDEKLRHECQYYLNLLLKAKEECADSSGGEVAIGLEELFIFPQVKSLCSAVEEIR